jgi:hypothetical protein
MQSMARKAEKKSGNGRGKSSKAKAAPTTAKKAGAAKSSGARGIVKRVVSTVVAALGRRKAAPADATNQTGARKSGGVPAKTARGARRQPDIPMDEIAAAYTPTQTSLKGPFRASGADRQRDQDYAGAIADDRWNDEDRITNKSGDPRIGTHGRTYEPGESRVAKGRGEEK